MKNSKFFRCLAFVGLATALLGTACSGPDKSVTFTVAFDTGGGSAVESQTVANTEYATKPADPVKDGFVFENWYMDSKCVTVFDFESVPITANWTLYANWTQRSTPYDDGGTPADSSSGGGEPEATTITYQVTGLPDWTYSPDPFHDSAVAVVFAHVWNSNGNDWVKAEKAGDNVVSFTLDKNHTYTGFLLVRVDPSTTTPNWSGTTDKPWNKTADMTFESGKTTYTISAWENV